MESFGTRLRALRRAAGLSQVDVGGQTYSGSYVSHLESGRRQPTPDVVDYLSGRLGVRPDELLGTEPLAYDLELAARDFVLAELNARTAWLEADFEQAARASHRAADAARRTGRLDAWWSSNGLRAQSMLAVGEYDVCAELAEMLSGHPIARESGAMRSEMLVLASKARRALGQLSEAVERAESAIAAAAEPPRHDNGLAQAHLAAVSALAESGRIDEAMRKADALRTTRIHVDSAHVRGLVAWGLGNLDFLTNEAERARAEYATAAELLRPEANLRSWARFRFSSAGFLLGAGIGEGVQELLDSAGTALSLVGHAGDRAELDMVYAELAIFNGDHTTALERIQAAAANPWPMPGNRVGELEVLRATALVGLGEKEEAQQALARAADQFEAAGAYRRALDAWRIHAQLIQSDSWPASRGLVLTGQPG